jgi:hypothetical protein
MSDFDPLKALAEGRSTETATPVRRLSFPDQCGLFAARQTAQRSVLAAAFGVTKTTVSLIANCQKDRARYGAIAREVARLGELEFARRYYTEDMHTRIMRLKHERAEVGDDRRPLGPTPLASKFAHARIASFLAPDYADRPTWFRIDWINNGWRFATCDPDGSNPSEYYGPHFVNPELDPEIGFRTSAEAYDMAWESVGKKSPRPKAGRPKNHP